MPEKEYVNIEDAGAGANLEAQAGDFKVEKNRFNKGIEECLLATNESQRVRMLTKLFYETEKAKLPVGEINNVIVDVLSVELGNGMMPGNFDAIVDQLKTAGFVIYNPLITEIAERAVEFANKNGEGQRAKDIREYFRLPEGNDW